MREALTDFITDELRLRTTASSHSTHRKARPVSHLGRFPYYKESQFAAIPERDQLNKAIEGDVTTADYAAQLDNGEMDGFMLRPMNCPMHIKIFDSEPHN